MDNNALLAPPTDDELKMFAPPTKEELAAASNSNSDDSDSYSNRIKTDLQTTKDALVGASNLGGLEPIAEGASKALLHKVIDDNSDKEGWGELYRKYQQIAHNRVKAAQERSPTASFVGGVAGMAVPAILSAGATAPESAAALGAEGLGEAGATLGAGEAATEGAAVGGEGVAESANALNAGQSTVQAAAPVAEAANPSLLAKAGRLGLKVGKSALQGAGVGAATGAMESEGTVEKNPEKMADDALSGAELGGIAGGVLSASGSAISAGKEGLGNWFNNAGKESQYYRKMAQGSAIGNDSGNLAKESVQLKVNQEIPNFVDQQFGKINEIRSNLGKPIRDVIKNANDEGTLIPTDSVDSRLSTLNTFLDENPLIKHEPAVIKVKALIATLKPEVGASASKTVRQLTPIETRDFLADLNDLKGRGNSPETSTQLNTLINGITSDLNNSLKEKIPEYGPMMARYASFMKRFPEQIIAKSGDTEDLPWYSDTDKSPGKLKNSLEDTIIKSGLDTRSGTEGTLARAKMFDKMQEFSNEEQARLANGDIEQSALPQQDVDAFKNQVQSLGDRRSVVGDFKGSTFGHEGFFSGLQRGVLGLPPLGKGTLPGILNKVSAAKSAITESTPAKFSQYLFSAPKQVLMGHAQTLKANPSFKLLGQALEDGLNNGDQAKQNAAVFSILQTPAAKRLLQPDSQQSE